MTQPEEKRTENSSSLLSIKKDKAEQKALAAQVHRYGKQAICETDALGHETPKNRSPLEIVVDASDGFIPLWAQDSTLRWRFQEQSLALFDNPEQIKDRVRELFGAALLEWGDAVPVKFAERDDAWDFEFVVRDDDNCNLRGCTLARAFFPDGGRHDLVLYPKMFGQSEKEQIETMIHELGHVFGLRHFFANISETNWASEIFGEHGEFSIMNYGPKSTLTQRDKTDLKTLYERVWEGSLPDINGTPVKLMKPFSATI